MKAKVEKAECIGCGMCETLCPEIFSMNDEGVAEAKDQEIPESLVESAEEAKDSCPADCIVIE